MPIPTPSDDEEQGAYMDRCMGDEYMQEFPQEQRSAVCGTRWREAKKGRARTDHPVASWKSDGEKRLVYAMVYAPDEEDSHGDYADAETIEDAAHVFMRDFRTVGLQHEREAPAHVVESYVAPQDMTVGGRAVKRGSWMIVVKVDDDELWQKVKAGEFGGVSLGGYAERE